MFVCFALGLEQGVCMVALLGDSLGYCAQGGSASGEAAGLGNSSFPIEAVEAWVASSFQIEAVAWS